MKNSKRIFLTTLLLTGVNFLTRTAGVWFNVKLSGIVGSAGIGLWNLILSVWFLSRTLGAAGLGLAATRSVIDSPGSAGRSLRKLYIVSFIQGSVAALILALAAKTVATRYIGDAGCAAALKMLAVSLPFGAISACTLGYAAAARKMARQALIGTAEQALRIGITLAAAARAQDTKSALFGAAVGITLSEIFSFAAGIAGVIRDRPGTKKEAFCFRKMLSSVALPDAAGSLVRASLSTLQNLLIPKCLVLYGAGSERSLGEYGLVHGMALPVVLYPSALIGVLSGLLLPEIAGTKNEKRRDRIASKVLRFSLVFSLAAAGSMAAFSSDLSLAVFGSTEASDTIRLFAPLVPVMYMDMTCDGILKGLGLQKEIMKINVLDSAVSVAMIALLVPKTGIAGYIIMVWATELMNFALSFSLLKKHSGALGGRAKKALKAFAVSAAAFAASAFLARPITLSDPTALAAVKIVLSLAVELLFLAASGFLRKNELKEIRNMIR
ncbi:MAG: polysaccharide biosynthesis C-terminal domain-containing protein [Clostridia bacterium]|nr:polysaccharide biosynthesis C-terminal domain-containing protein [Clostridia bacterium]